MSSERAKFRPEIDFLKGVAIIFVILIHLIGLSLDNFLHQSLTFKALLTLDQWARLSVPLFVFISGLTLATSAVNRPVSLKDFYLRRVWRILPLYIVWSGLIIVIRRWLGDYPSGYVFDPLFSILAWGSADYHLYFVPMIFQLYVLFPILYFLVKKFRSKAIIVAFIWQLVAYLYIKTHTEINLPGDLVIGDQDQYIFFGSWLFYYVLGLYLALNQELISKIPKILKTAVAIVIVGSFVVAVWDTFRIISVGWDIIIATRFTKISVLVYASAVLFASQIFVGFFGRLPGLLVKVFVLFGKRSYLIYLFHTLVIRIIYGYIKPKTEVNFIILSLLVISSSLVLSQLFHQIPKLLDLSRKILK